eukprot:3402707-Amphidinium_carterae.1
MSSDTMVGSKSEWGFRVHHSTDGSLWFFFFFCRFPWQTDSRFVVRSFTQLGAHKPPKVKDRVSKLRPSLRLNHESSGSRWPCSAVPALA